MRGVGGFGDKEEWRRGVRGNEVCKGGEGQVIGRELIKLRKVFDDL